MSAQVKVFISSGHVRLCQVKFVSGPDTLRQVSLRLSDQVMSGQVRSYQISLCQVSTVSGQIRSMSGHVRSGPDRRISVLDRKKSCQFSSDKISSVQIS